MGKKAGKVSIGYLGGEPVVILGQDGDRTTIGRFASFETTTALVLSAPEQADDDTLEGTAVAIDDEPAAVAADAETRQGDAATPSAVAETATDQVAAPGTGATEAEAVAPDAVNAASETLAPVAAPAEAAPADDWEDEDEDDDQDASPGADVLYPFGVASAAGNEDDDDDDDDIGTGVAAVAAAPAPELTAEPAPLAADAEAPAVTDAGVEAGGGRLTLTSADHLAALRAEFAALRDQIARIESSFDEL